MSGFGGGFGGGGGGGSSGGSFGGGRGNNSGRSGGRGRSSSRGRGRGRGRTGGGGGGGGRDGGGDHFVKTLLNPCANFTKTGNCHHGNNCRFAHVVKLHAIIEASSAVPDNNANNDYNNNNRYNQTLASVSSVAIWETGGAIKLFTGSHDGFWRLWNFVPNTGFMKEFEHNMGGPVHSLVVASNFLFCGFESISPLLPEINVGMVHAWNLANPADPPLEFHMSPLAPYAHAQGVTQLLVDGTKVVSGSKDGGIKLWSFDAAANGFKLTQEFSGHAREITGLAVADTVLWSSSIDGSIRIWDLIKGECQYLISMAHAGATPPPPGTLPPQSPGHTHAVTNLVSFKSASGIFILSSSLDGDVKAWNGTTGQCVASESNGEGVVTMSMGADSAGKPLLLLGLESGSIMVRNLEPTPKIQQAFAPILKLSQHITAGHLGAVKALAQGSPGTFYSGGMDGQALVFEFTGDLGL